LSGVLEDLNIHGERPIIDYTNTVDWRGKEEPTEYINNYQDLLKWATLTGVISETYSQNMLKAAQNNLRKAEEVYKRALAFREAAYNTFTNRADVRPANTIDEATISEESKVMFQHLTLDLNSQKVELRDSNDLEYILWALVKDFVDLVTSDDALRVKRCASDECGWLFIDHSKNKSRKWCDMRGCGNRAKARRYYKRQKN
jgi:predicted RNA-binding Zn ribbon-like protein